MIEVRGLTKRYGEKTAVDDLTFTVQPGIVTGFLGPNGAGKSTTMRMVLGLDTPTSGTATVAGRPYREHDRPLHVLGALLEAKAVHTSRSARNHLRALAATHGISDRRVDEVIGMVGLQDVARRRAGGFSLGMGQRLGIASALLGDPETVMLDEPVNGLDPEGIRWIRDLLKQLADEGRTVFLSSHLMSEMAQTAEHVVVVGRGRLIADVPIAQLISGAPTSSVLVRSAEPTALAAALVRQGAEVVADGDGGLQVSGVDAPGIGEVALAERIALHELTPHRASLEEVFMDMTRDDVEYAAADSEARA
ncbi:ABC-2 type transport system ATP-binding protein [Motilibacter rhizosphaerae]|uniref:ABC-2 type transport system ATP-binding protein n=1 Tax=Motilibacter rhizosphaerae TaxID=598652 RepID=A0A4V2F4M6_9ACTN|nr:ABC transporter ATP-binding protein [Motilibacter rhizosphaerae]RZS89849.1 ABC-2 type transport system ATP-binding protein [Motilibacter rhizosphaerae]